MSEVSVTLAPRRMLSPRYRRLWLRRLRRRPLLPFLLAATLAVDLTLLLTYSDLDSPFLGGVLGGQIALLATWVTHQRRGALARSFVALVVLLLAMECTFGLPLEPKAETVEGELEDWFFDFDLRPAFYVVLSTMAALATLTAWIIRAVCASGIRTSVLRPRCRFQISSLLWATLILVVLLSFGRHGDWAMLLDAESLLLFVIIEVTPLLVLLPISLLTKHNVTKVLWLIAVPCVALLAAIVFWPEGLFAYYASHAAFFGAWLYLASDRGPRPEPAPVQETIEPPPAPIDLHA